MNKEISFSVYYDPNVEGKEDTVVIIWEEEGENDAYLIGIASDLEKAKELVTKRAKEWGNENHHYNIEIVPLNSVLL